MVGSIVAGYILGAAAVGTATYFAVAFAVNIVASSIISKAFAPNIDNASLNAINPGNPQQQPPASDNKLPVVYGTGWVGGAVVDLSITTNNQVISAALFFSCCTCAGLPRRATSAAARRNHCAVVVRVYPGGGRLC